MNLTSIAAPADVDELALAELDVTPSIKVAPPRITASPVAFECRLHTPLQFASGQFVVIGEVVQAHVDDDCVLDAGEVLHRYAEAGADRPHAWAWAVRAHGGDVSDRQAAADEGGKIKLRDGTGWCHPCRKLAATKL